MPAPTFLMYTVVELRYSRNHTSNPSPGPLYMRLMRTAPDLPSPDPTPRTPSNPTTRPLPSMIYCHFVIVREDGRFIFSRTQRMRRGFPCRHVFIYMHKSPDFVRFDITCVHERWLIFAEPDGLEGALKERCAMLHTKPPNTARDTIVPAISAVKGIWQSLAEWACA